MLIPWVALLLVPVCRSDDWSPRPQRRNDNRVYSLPSAVNYGQEARWREFKRAHDDQVARDEDLSRRMNQEARPPAPAFDDPGSAPARRPAARPPSGPSYAEVREFKDTFAETVKDFIADRSRSKRGSFQIKDDRSGEVLRLKLQHIRLDGLRYHSPTLVSGCADFVTMDAPKRTVDLDFELSKDWDWTVARVYIHSINGRDRFAYDADNRRIAARTAAAAPVPKPTAPANLSADIKLDGASGGGVDSLSISVSNAGPGMAYAVTLRFDVRAAPAGVGLPPETALGDIPPGRSVTKSLPVSIADGAAGGAVKAVSTVVEGNGFDTEPVLIEFETAAKESPALALAAASVDGGSIKPGETARLSVSVRNVGRGRAVGARVALRLGGADLFLSGEPSMPLGDLEPNESKEAVFEFFVNKRVKPGADLSVFLTGTDAEGRHGFADVPLPLTLGQGGGPLRIVSLASPAAVDSLAVDRPPSAKTPKDPDAYAVVIGIEKYRDVGGVDYAARDTQSVYDYLVESMGFLPENVALLKDERAGRADLSTYLGPWLADRAGKGKKRVFIYYSGHGTVNPRNGETYMVPYDGDPSYPETKGFALKDLYAALGRLPDADTIVTLDSCFSGTGGRAILAAGLRPLVPVKSTPIPANVVVLSASKENQVSAGYPRARHGLMTYFMLRGLGGAADANHDGRVTTVELYRYLSPAVETEARAQHVEQMPRLDPPPESIGARGSRVWVSR